jgi:hypothetical protein
MEADMIRRSSTRISLVIALGLACALLVIGTALAGAAEEALSYDLEVTLQAPTHVAPNSQYRLNLRYTNLGNTASPDGTWVSVRLPAGVTFIQAADQDGQPLPPDQVAGQVLTWELGSLPTGDYHKHLWITLQVAPDLKEGDLLTAEAEIGPLEDDLNPDNNQAGAISEVCDMAGSTKQAQSGQVKSGDTVIYTVTLELARRSAPGAIQQRAITFTDLLPPAEQARFLGWVGVITGTQDGQTLRWQGTLHAGEPVRLQYRLGIPGDVPTGTLVTNRAYVHWQGGDLELAPASVAVVLGADDHMFGPQGGEWQHAYGVTLQVPPNAVTETTRFQFRPMFSQDPPPELPPGWQWAHRAFEITAFQFGELHRFNQPITITVAYTPQDIVGMNQKSLRLWYRNSSGEPWAMLGEPVRNQNGLVSFQTDHLTEFILLGQGEYRLFLPVLRR